MSPQRRQWCLGTVSLWIEIGESQPREEREREREEGVEGICLFCKLGTVRRCYLKGVPQSPHSVAALSGVQTGGCIDMRRAPSCPSERRNQSRTSAGSKGGAEAATAGSWSASSGGLSLAEPRASGRTWAST